jgi:hypothetical protein
MGPLTGQLYQIASQGESNWQHKENSSGKDTLHQERKPCTVERWEVWEESCELMHLNAFHLHSDNCFTRNLVRN